MGSKPIVYPMITIGVTGSREGGTPLQYRRLQRLLREFRDKGATILVHGDCVGVDEFAAKVADSYGYKLHSRPCTIAGLRANVPSEVVHEPKAPLLRNKEIVDQCDVLLAVPKQSTEVVRSGTWMTVRYARSAHKRIVLIRPDGTTQESRGP